MKPTVPLAFLLLIAPAASAQDRSASAFATLEAVVVDSLRGGFASGATVIVVGTTRVGFADSSGRVRIDSVPSGTYVVELSYDVLDTVGLRVRTPPLSFHAGSVVDLALGIPSAGTILRAKCGAAGEGEVALLGIVLEADREDPVAGAQVRLTWMETTVNMDVGVHRAPQQRAATTDAAGRYKFCGLPKELEAELSARFAADSTPPVVVRFGAAAIGTATLFLTVRDSAATAAGGGAPVRSAIVRGVVVDSAGRPLRGVRVGLTSSTDATVTDSAGIFSLSGQQSGTRVLVARRIGYQPAEMVVNLTRTAPREVVVRLAAFVPVLEAVYVEARRNAALERIGFSERQRAGFGRFLTPSDLATKYAFVVSDYLRHLPAARASGLSGGSCTTHWVDGMRWLGDPDDFVSASEVAAIEVYSGTYVPAEFQSFDGGCRVVVIWTKWKVQVR